MIIFRALIFLLLSINVAGGQPFRPRACDVTTVSTGGTAVTAISGPVNGYYIFNPLLAVDQGIGAAEPLYIDTVGTATTSGNATNSAIAPGQAFYGIGLTNTTVSVNAATTGHAFTCVRW